MARLNPAQHRLLQRHMERAVETLGEADRLLKGLVSAEVESCVQHIQKVLGGIDHDKARMLTFRMDDLPTSHVACLDNPFAQSLAFNLYCIQEGLSHTRGAKAWEGGNAAVTARNLVFLPPVFGELWEEGAIDKTRLVHIANRSLTPRAYEEVAEMVRTRRKEDLDEFLLKVPADYLRSGRRGPDQALDAAVRNGWFDRFETVQIAEDLVADSGTHATTEAGRDGGGPEEAPAEAAVRSLRAGLHGAGVAKEVVEGLRLSPDPQVLVERFLTAHRQSGDPDPQEVNKTLFFAHAGPIQRLAADDKLLLRHFRPVKTQKRGQLFYRVLEVIEEAMLERQHLPDHGQRGISEEDAMEAVRGVVIDLNQDPNRYLEVPDEWLGEVTRRHLYFGSRTRKEGSAYKWYRKLGHHYFLGAHKTPEEMAEKQARREAKAAAR